VTEVIAVNQTNRGLSISGGAYDPEGVNKDQPRPLGYVFSTGRRGYICCRAHHLS
jgi:hypothetical protein